MSTSAEKIEERLRKRGKRSDLPHAEAETLLTHPLLEGLVDCDGNHARVIRNPYKLSRQKASAIAGVLGTPKLEGMLLKSVIPVSYHRGMLLFAYVNEILDFLEMRRLILDNGLEALIR